MLLCSPHASFKMVIGTRKEFSDLLCSKTTAQTKKIVPWGSNNLQRTLVSLKAGFLEQSNEEKQILWMIQTTTTNLHRKEGELFKTFTTYLLYQGTAVKFKRIRPKTADAITGLMIRSKESRHVACTFKHSYFKLLTQDRKKNKGQKLKGRT